MSEPETECIISINNNQNHTDDSKTEINASDSTPSANDSLNNQQNDPAETSMSEVTKEECSSATVNELVSAPEQQVDPIDLYRKLEIIKEIK